MYTINLNQISKNDIEMVGGKGANLGELMQNKIPVPQGFVVTTTAYDEYLHSNGIDKIIDKILLEEKSATAELIRSNISNGIFPDKMLEDIKKSYEDMKGVKRVAVRSSATAEDREDASFAGQQETYLNVQGIDNVLKRVKDCFASCFSERSIEYRKQAGYNNVKAAVVVQEMVEAETAGVLFTENVLSGNINELLINSAYGLGEAVVSGTVNPDQYILDKNGRVINRQLGKKECKIIYGEKEIIKVSVEPKQQKEWTLNEDKLRRLYEIGKNIEKIYGKPMDIEWAEKENKIYVVQARTITTINKSEPRVHEREKIKLSKIAKKNLAFNLEHVPYAYYPLDFEVSMILAQEKQKLFNEMGITLGESYEINENGCVTLGNTKVKINKNIIHILKTIKNYTDIERNKEKGKTILNQCNLQLNKYEQLEMKDKTLSECAEIFRALLEIQRNIGYARFRYFIFPAVIIGKKLKKYLKGEENFNEYDLLSDLSYRTWKINQDIKKIADELKYEINDEHKIKSLSLEQLSNSGKEKIANFLKKHGYKSNYNCYPFSGISWNENKKEFLQLLKAAMNNTGVDKANKKYESVINTLKKNAGNRQKEVIYKAEYYRECHVYREESQYMWEKCYAILRRVLNEVSVKLQIQKESLWFLMFSELLLVCERGSISNEEIKKIKTRKAHRYETENYWQELGALVIESGSKENVIIGVNGSSGGVSGHACVVLGKEDFSKLKKGDILICNCTSPEWTPLFSIASAVVSDTGGALSHAAIVAREYGIPAVLGTGNATLRIHDGDKIYVDGTKGKVMLLNAE